MKCDENIQKLIPAEENLAVTQILQNSLDRVKGSTWRLPEFHMIFAY